MTEDTKNTETTEAVETAPAAAASEVKSSSETVKRVERRRFPRHHILLLVTTVLMVAIVGSLATWTIQLRRQQEEQTQHAAQLTRTLAVTMDLARRRVPLLAPGGQLMAMMFVSADNAVIVSTGNLPENRVPQETYVLWGTGQGNPTALATFDVIAGQNGLRPLISLSFTGNFSAFTVSLEPGRSMPTTLTQTVATGQIEH